MYGFLGSALGALSIVMLIKMSFDTGSLLDPLRVIIDYYVRFVDIFIGTWVDPLARHIVRLLPWQLNLTLDWKHVFILMWLYFGSNARAAWNVGNRGTAIFKFLWGGSVALASSTAAGVGGDLFLALWPIVGLAIFEIGDSIWNAIVRTPIGESRWARLLYSLKQDLGIFVAALFGFGVTVGLQLYFGPSRAWGLMLLGLVAIGLAFYWIRRGYVRAVINNQGMGINNQAIGATLSQKFFNDGATKIGMHVIYAFLGAFAFFALGAGGNLAGF